MEVLVWGQHDHLENRTRRVRSEGQGRSSASVTYSQSTWPYLSMTTGTSCARESSRAIISATSSLSSSRVSISVPSGREKRYRGDLAEWGPVSLIRR
jgi:hypothetical protein